MTIKPLIALSTLLALGACAPVDHSFGEATAWNEAVQTINPDGVAVGPDAAQPGDNADVAVAAAEAYREGTVERPTVRSSGGAGLGGSGGGIGTGGSGGTPPR